MFETKACTIFPVNNVGVMLPRPMKFGEASEFDIWSHVNVNVAAVLAMTKLVLPGMVSRHRGAIINLASIAGTHPLPLMGIYGATKVCQSKWEKIIV